MTDKEKLEALARPFPANEVAWRIRSVGINGSRPWAMVSCYVTNRAVMDGSTRCSAPATGAMNS